MRSLTRAHSFFFANNKGTFGNKKKKEVVLFYDDRQNVPPVTAVISVARCRAFDHRTRAFLTLSMGNLGGMPRDRPSPVRRSSTGHRPAAHTCMCRRWLPRRHHRPDAAETLHPSYVWLGATAPTRPSGHARRGRQQFEKSRAPAACLYHCLGFQLDTLTLRRCAAVAS